MPKQIPRVELDAVRAAVGRYPGGASVEDISRALTLELPRRTLQRRLALLVERGQLLRDGSGPASRYRLSSIRGTVQVAEATDTVEAYGELAIPLSGAGKQIQKTVRLPMQQRNPVGYRREFLEAYQPNRSFYLSGQSRQHLLGLGRSYADQQPAGTYALRIFHRLLIDLSWNSSRLEGNTYSLLETEHLLDTGESAEGRNALETQMILNHKAAIELLVESAPEVGFNSYTLCNLHALLSQNLLPDPAACGRLRSHGVGIGGSVFQPLIGQCFQNLLIKAGEIEDPFEQAFFAMVHLPYLQPFDDVNKRVSRLAANIPLIRENLSPLSFVDVPDKAYIDGLRGVYELNRTELLADVFVWAYERSCSRYSAVRQSLGEPEPFRLRYREAIGGLVRAIVTGGLDRTQAVRKIREYAGEGIGAEDRARFIEVTETELMSLHEGNMARYRIRPAEFSQWHNNW